MAFQMTVWQVWRNVGILKRVVDIFSFVLIQKKQKIKVVENLGILNSCGSENRLFYRSTCPAEHVEQRRVFLNNFIYIFCNKIGSVSYSFNCPKNTYKNSNACYSNSYLIKY